jgi:DNA-binding GntR family transcriptional regulator
MSSSLRTTITDELVELLRAEILSGELAPGSRLRQGEVAARFNVSTTPVREAFAALVREGLLIGSPHRGVIVFQPAVEDLEELYEIRIPLEALATRLAVPQLSPENIRELESVLMEMENPDLNAARYNELDARFHAEIYRAASRPRLDRLIADLRESSAACLRACRGVSWSADAGLTRPAPTPWTHHEHMMILEACKAKAPKRAAKAMVEHLQHTADHYSEQLEKLRTKPTQPARRAPTPRRDEHHTAHSRR